MNSRNRPFTRSANKFFRPALDLLNNHNFSTPDPRLHKKRSSAQLHQQHHNRDPSIDDTDDIEHYATKAMDSNARTSHSTQNSLTELQPPVPLIDIGSASGSRAASPYPRSRSAVQSDDEDDDFEPADSIRPLVSSDVGSGGRRGVWKQGGLGAFFFGTWVGWQIWVGLLVFWVGGCSFGLLLMNRFILLTGVYKFGYPVTHTYLQFLFTHFLLIGFSSLTRVLGSPLRRLGFGAAVAPAYPTAPTGGAFRQSNKQPSLARFGRWLTNGQGGIAGGGLFEFDKTVAKQVLPLAIVFVTKVLLSTISFTYAGVLPVYQLSRIAIIPMSLIISSALQSETHSAATLSSSLIATLNLLFACIRSHVRVTSESIVAGVFSSFFAALFPILLLRTYRALVHGLTPQGEALSGSIYPTTDDAANNREETRAYYRTLHYTSLLSLVLLTPILLLSGELSPIWFNLPFLDVPFFWFMIWCGAIGSWAVFSSTLLLVKATSPLTATFVSVPRAAFQLVMLSAFKMPVHSWVGVVLCWLSSLWFMVVRREEGRVLERLRLESGR